MMDFAEAKNVVVMFGKYKGQTIDSIAGSNKGLLWLDWARGLVDKGEMHVNPRVKSALTVYLSDATIAKEVEAAIEERGR